jgi:hypothetical protein
MTPKSGNGSRDVVGLPTHGYQIERRCFGAASGNELPTVTIIRSTTRTSTGLSTGRTEALAPVSPKATALSSCFVPAQASSPEPQTLLAQTTNEGPRTAFCPSGICRGKQWLRGTESWPSASALAVKSSSQRCVERERQSHQIRYSVPRGTVLEYRFLLFLFPSFHFPFPLVSSFLRLLDGAGYFSARAKAVGSGRLQVGPIPQSRSGNNGPVSLA